MSITKHATYLHNPFRLEPAYFRRIGEISADAELKYKTRDMEDHIRIFPNAYDDFRNLNSMAVKLLGFICKELDTDIVRLNIIDLMGEFSVSSKYTIYRGIEDLLEKQFMAKKAGTDIYFINPGKIFKRSRSKWFDETKNFDMKNKDILPKISSYKTQDNENI